MPEPIPDPQPADGAEAFWELRTELAIMDLHNLQMVLAAAAVEILNRHNAASLAKVERLASERSDRLCVCIGAGSGAELLSAAYTITRDAVEKAGREGA